MLEISEPGNGATHAPPAFGIDLGTTHSLIALAGEDGLHVFADETGEPRLPSVVARGPKGLLVGAPAQERNDAVFSFKRLMGRGIEDTPLQNAPEAFGGQLKGNQQVAALDVGGTAMTPVALSAEVLKTLAERAAEAVKEPVSRVVVTVPAYFNDAQRQATRDAARLAGLEVLRLLAEPTAAALAYGLDKNAQGLYLVYDLGGGTFDVSLLKLTDGVFQVIATGGDTWLGGDDIDRAVAATLPTEIPLVARLRAARALKEELTQNEAARANLNGHRLCLTRQTLEEAATPLLEKTLAIVREVLRDAEVTAEQVEGIVLAGGSTRMPLVEKRLAKTFNCAVYNDLNPDEVVVRGAALQAAALSGRGGHTPLLLDVTPLSLGLETMGGLVEKIIPRNTPIPISRAQEFTTFKDGQTAMDIHVLQGERETVEGCRSLASFRLGGIPPMAAGRARVRVSFHLDADGLLTVSAQEQTTGTQQDVTVTPSYGLEEGEILAMLKSAFAHAGEDVATRTAREAAVELERVIDACESALMADGHLLSDQEQSDLYTVVEQARKELKSEDANHLRALMANLDKSFADFAARRMETALQKSVVGKKAEEFNGSEQQ